MLAIRDLPLIALLTLRDDDIVVFLPGHGLYPIDGLGKEIVIDVADDDADGFAPASLQALGNGIGFVIVFAGIGEYVVFRILADLMTTPQGF